MLSHLESLHIDFNPPPSRPDRPNRWPPLPTTCSIFPALTRILFFGDSDYLEDLVARIDAPLLDSIGIIFCRSFISDIPQLAQFMRRTTRIQGGLQALKEAYVNIDDYGIVVHLLHGHRPLTKCLRCGSHVEVMAGSIHIWCKPLRRSSLPSSW